MIENESYKSDADLARELETRKRLLHKSEEDAGYVSYPSGAEGQFIHEYAGGRRVLVEKDPETGKERFLREL